MQTKPLFILNKSGYVIRPEAFELLPGYVASYIRLGQTYLSERTKHAPQVPTQLDHNVANAQLAIRRAEAFMAELKRVRGHIVHWYDRNFEMWAESFRQTRLQLRLQRIEDSPHLYAMAVNVMQMLKAENPRFSESKFIKYINN